MADAIAIVGMACRFAGADDYRQYWANCENGVSSITEVPPERWDWRTLALREKCDLKTTGVRWGGFANNVKSFDNELFEISDREAYTMDPQQRMALELAWSCFEDAGVAPRSVTNRAIGVWLAVCNQDYKELHDRSGTRFDLHLSGNEGSIVPNRISHFFSLRGPSLAIDTACSSSLFALHGAIASLRQRHVEMALAGGVSLMVAGERYLSFDRLGMLSNSGACHTYDASADGYVRGEGGGIVLLKRLDDALNDGDPVHAVLLDVALNHGGRARTLTSPNAFAQSAVVADAWRHAGVQAHEIGMIEAHGTGTPLGDPIEVHGLRRAFGQLATKRKGRAKAWCGLTSAKTNIGHCEGSAGIAGVIRAALAIRNGVLPPLAEFRKINPHIKLNKTPFYIVEKAQPWKTAKDSSGRRLPRRAGVSSFGFGGANGHAALEQAPELPFDENVRPVFIPVSGRNSETLRENIHTLLNYLEAHGSTLRLVDIALSLRIGRETLDSRVAFLAENIGPLLEVIRRWLQADEASPGVFETPEVSTSDTEIYAQERKLAEEWLSGSNEPLTKADLADARRIHLPGIHFLQREFWLPEGERVHNFFEKPKSPLGRVEQIDDARCIWSASDLNAWVADHCFEDRPILAGSVSLELIRIAATELSIEIDGLQDLKWHRPLTLTGESAVEIAFDPPEDGTRTVTVRSAGIPCCTARIGPVASSLEVDTIDLAEIEQASAQPGETARARLEAQGFRFGPSFRSLGDIRIKNGRLLAALHFEGAAEEDFVLHPSLIDGAIQAITMLLPTGPTYKPYRLEAVGWKTKLPSVSKAHIRTRDGDGDPTFDIHFVDASGRVVAWIDGFTVRPQIIATAESERGAGAQSRTLYWRPRFVPEELPTTGPEPARILLVDDHADGLRDALRSAVAIPPVVINLGLDAPTLDGLMADLEPDLVVLRFSNSDDASARTRLLTAALALSRGLTGSGRRDATFVAVNTPTDQSLSLDLAGISGLQATLYREHPAIRTRTIEWRHEEGLSSLASAIVRECFDESRGHGRVRYISAVREKQSFEPAKMDVAQPPAFRRQGVYLITGGLGGLGRILCQHIVRTFDARVMLVGRRPLDVEDKAWLESLGSQVAYHPGDMSHPQDAEAAIRSTREAFGALHGIVHGAGVLADRMLAQTEPGDLLHALAPKLQGAINLDAAIDEAPLELFLVHGSVVGAMGNMGQAAYACANAYVHEFVRNRSATRSGHSLAISWPLWSDGGMRPPEPVLANLERRTGLQPMPTGEGLTALEAAIASNEALLIVSHGEPELCRAYIQGSPTPVSTTSEPLEETEQPKQNGALSREDILSATYELLAKEFAAALWIDPKRMTPDGSLARLGIDSLIAAQILAKLEARIGALPSTLMFEHQNIASVGTWLLENRETELMALLGQKEAPTTSPSKSNAGPIPQPVTAGIALSTNESTHAATNPREGDIAVIGLSARYPKAPDLQSFWRVLSEGIDCIEEIPSERWNHSDVFHPVPGQTGKTYGKWGGFIEDHDCFDPLFFHISPREAEVIDPQERLFLESAWTALEDAGYSRSELARQFKSNVGVYAGVMWTEYQLHGVGFPGRRPYSSVASVANRVSYVLGLHGPSIGLDTMCSSSLTAVILGCQALQRGDCQLALAGGVNLSLHPSKFQYLAQERFLSTDGRCRSFGEGGDGYVPGEGVGVAVLKPYARAVEDGDHIYCRIKGAALNHGGTTHGYTVPNPDAQASLLERSLHQADFDPRSLSYLEAHSAGTSLGDPIELRSIARVLGDQWDKDRRCAIGAVKSNLGHLESAAGIAGLTKVALQLKHGELVPSLHTERLNPNIDFDTVPFRVCRQREPWLGSPTQPRRAGINSFGAGGANAHILVEEHFDVERTESVFEEQLLPLSALSPSRLHALVKKMRDFAQQAAHTERGASLRDVAFTLQVGREQLSTRMIARAHTFTEWLTALERYLADDPIHVNDNDALGDVASRWLSGESVDFRALHQDAPRRISLPTYPFERRRCWVSASPPAQTTTPSNGVTNGVTMENTDAYAIIGGGPCGIGVAKCLLARGLPVEIIEREADFGGVWDPSTTSGRVYRSTHLISTKLNTQFSDFPMPDDYPTYPSHQQFLDYLRTFAQHHDLYAKASLGTSVERAHPSDGRWIITTSDGRTRSFRGLVVANGLQREPVYGEYPGTFTGEIVHSSSYRNSKALAGKRVLVIGGGNSGCDIAVDCVHGAQKVVHSMRRAYYFMPRFIEGQPLQEWIMGLSRRIQAGQDLWQYVGERLHIAGFEPTSYGLPKPDYGIEQAHPIINSHYLCHVGQGDIISKPDVQRFDGQRVDFVDGSHIEVDIILYATGYRPSFPFFEDGLIAWAGARPDLFLRMFHRDFDNLFFVGFLNAAAGLGNIVNAMGSLIASTLKARETGGDAFERFRELCKGPEPQLSEGEFIASSRHDFEVDLWRLLRTLAFFRDKLEPVSADPKGTAQMIHHA